jgi:hypothetical protein
MLTSLFLALFHPAGTRYPPFQPKRGITHDRPVIPPKAVHDLLRGLQIEYLHARLKNE